MGGETDEQTKTDAADDNDNDEDPREMKSLKLSKEELEESFGMLDKYFDYAEEFGEGLEETEDRKWIESDDFFQIDPDQSPDEEYFDNHYNPKKPDFENDDWDENWNYLGRNPQDLEEMDENDDKRERKPKRKKEFDLTKDIKVKEGRVYLGGFEVPPEQLPQILSRPEINNLGSFEEDEKQETPRKKMKKPHYKFDPPTPYDDPSLPQQTRRQKQVGEKIATILDHIVLAKDEELFEELQRRSISIVQVYMSRSLRKATVYYNYYDPATSLDEFEKLLDKAASKIRYILAEEAQLKYSPELKFIHVPNPEVVL